MHCAGINESLGGHLGQYNLPVILDVWLTTGTEFYVENRIILFLISLTFSQAFYLSNSSESARNCWTFCFVPGVKHQGDMSKELCVISTFFKRDALRDVSAGINFPLASQLAHLNSECFEPRKAFNLFIFSASWKEYIYQIPSSLWHMAWYK